MLLRQRLPGPSAGGASAWRLGARGAADAGAARTGFSKTAVVKTVKGDPILVGEFTNHFRTYFSGWIGMFTGTSF